MCVPHRQLHDVDEIEENTTQCARSEQKERTAREQRLAFVRSGKGSIRSVMQNVARSSKHCHPWRQGPFIANITGAMN